LLTGINHVATVTQDLDRLQAFYRSAFDAEVLLDLKNGDIRHSFVQVGPTTVLHAFEQPENRHARGVGDIFDRGHIDHLALSARSREAFDEIRARLMAQGAADGTLTDFGSMLSVFFRDPDGMECEICWIKDGASLADTIEPEGFAPRDIRC
jgi:catechol 2,3-dioxygenase-like lactoylglutathione lyase family enzyme